MALNVFVDCFIDGTEDTRRHFLFCHLYDACRRDLLKSVNAVLRQHGLSNLFDETLL